jgi:hypothetical protein
MPEKSLKKQIKAKHKRVGKRNPSRSKATVILSSETAPDLAPQLEKLISGFASGEIKTVQAALKALLKTHNDPVLPDESLQFLQLFHSAVWALRCDLDLQKKSQHTLTLAEVAANLARLRSRAEEATQVTIRLIEKQEHLCTNSERLVTELETLLKCESLDRAALQKELQEWRSLTAEMRKLSVELLCNQDFEDLCGFILPNVQVYVKALSAKISGLFGCLKVDLPEQHSQDKLNASTQTDVDELIRQHRS